jgi:hypothetical protein
VVPVLSLWLPILVAAVLVFIASSVIHMFLTYHQTDFNAVPDEDKVMAALRPFNLQPGDYMMPKPANTQAMKTPEFQEKVKQGPVLLFTVLPSRMFDMGPALGQWFVFSLVVSLFAAYIAGRALPPGAEYLAVFRFAGTTAFIGYSLAQWPNSIWFRKSWSATLKNTFDGLVYGLLTAGAFGWLWPSS